VTLLHRLVQVMQKSGNSLVLLVNKHGEKLCCQMLCKVSGQLFSCWVFLMMLLYSHCSGTTPSIS